jgi:hypothetical protein
MHFQFQIFGRKNEQGCVQYNQCIKKTCGYTQIVIALDFMIFKVQLKSDF